MMDAYHAGPEGVGAMFQLLSIYRSRHLQAVPKKKQKKGGKLVPPCVASDRLLQIRSSTARTALSIPSAASEIRSASM